MVELLAERAFQEFGQNQGAKQGAGPPSEPLVDRHHGAVILLDLLLPQGQVSHERYIEITLNHPLCRVSQASGQAKRKLAD